MAKNFIIEQLKEEFRGKPYFTRNILMAFYRQFDPDLNESTFRWRLYQLRIKRIITPLSQNHFMLGYKPDFKPDVSAVGKLAIKVGKKFPTMKYCIWSTQVINEFMLHIPGKFMTILEVEKDALEPLYEFLKANNFNNVYIKPEEKEIERYILGSGQSIVLQSLISKSPIQKLVKVYTITLEKLIVDLFCGKNLFITFQGTELIHIINIAYQRYSINYTKLFHYASRRGKEVDLRIFLKEKTDISRNILHDKV